jgi:hypothetical protein
MTALPEHASLALLHRLFVRTREGKVKWEPTQTDRTVVAHFAGYDLYLYSRDDPEYPDSPDFFIEIRDDQDRKVDEISNVSLGSLMDQKIEGLNPYQALTKLHNTAVRSALGADRAIGSILDQLE